MGDNLDISLKCKGSPLHALDKAKKISEAIGETVHVYFAEGFFVGVSQESNLSDLYEIYGLRAEIKELESKSLNLSNGGE